MIRILALSERTEVPSRGELWSILLGALLASVLLVSAFRVASEARTPVVPDEELAYRAPVPVLVAAPKAERPGTVVVKPEARVRVHRHAHAHPVAPRP